MVGANQQTDNMGDHQTDKADHTGHGHRHTYTQGRQYNQAAFDALHIDTQMTGLGFT